MERKTETKHAIRRYFNSIIAQLYNITMKLDIVAGTAAAAAVSGMSLSRLVINIDVVFLATVNGANEHCCSSYRPDLHGAVKLVSK